MMEWEKICTKLSGGWLTETTIVTSSKNCIHMSSSSGPSQIRDCIQQFAKDVLKIVVIMSVAGALCLQHRSGK